MTMYQLDPDERAAIVEEERAKQRVCPDCHYTGGAHHHACPSMPWDDGDEDDTDWLGPDGSA